MNVDIAPFRNALARLQEGYARYEQDITDTQIRDGLIQRFEFTYEIAHKTLRRFLGTLGASPEEYQAMAFPDLIRSANRYGLLLGDWPIWRHYRDMRGKTSHTYDEAVALDVVRGIPEFIEEASHLADELARRSA